MGFANGPGLLVKSCHFLPNPIRWCGALGSGAPVCVVGKGAERGGRVLVLAGDGRIILWSF